MLPALLLFPCASVLGVAHYTNDLRGAASSLSVARTADPWDLDELVDIQKNFSSLWSTVSEDLMVENAEFAIQGRSLTAGLENISEAMFIQNVLPMRQLDEPVESWRSDFFQKLSGLADGKSSLRAVAEAVIPAVFAGSLGSTVNFKANQTPGIMAPVSGTLQHGYASCSGLSILVADALRAVGVPARVVGTASWNIATGGNHNWVEVWWSGEWHFIDATPPGDSVSWDSTWFIDNAAKSVPGTIHGIYTALASGPGDGVYSFTWRDPYMNVTAEDRSLFYQSLVQTVITDPRADEYRDGSEAGR